MNALKRILLIKDGEGRQLGFFLLLFLFLGAGMAIGRGTADALFLKRYGIEYLPVMYLVLSAIYAISFTVYAAFVDRLPPERFFCLLLALQGALLFLFWIFIAYTRSEIVYPAYFLLYELASEIIVIHATFYVGQNMDTLQSKRLMPLVFSGYQMGMVCGGLFLATTVQVAGVENAVIAWCVLIAIGITMLLLWHGSHGVSPFFIPPPSSKRNRIVAAVNEVTQGLRFIRQSALLRNSSYALFFMVITFYVLTFSVNKIYSESFDSEESLTTFFGYLVAATNLTALVLQLFASNRIVGLIGVRKAKLIYPVTTIISYVLLLISPGFYMALIASINNGSVLPAIRNPVRQMFFNVLPDYMKGRARATSVALVLPVAIFTCGMLILYLQSAHDTSIILLLGLVTAMLYLWFSYKMGRDYVTTLVNTLKEKLYLPGEVSKAGYLDGNDRVYEALARGIEDEDDSVSLSYARLMLDVFPEESIDLILDRVQKADINTADQMVSLVGEKTGSVMSSKLLEYAGMRDDHFKATIYEAIFSDAADMYTGLIEKCLLHDNPRIRVSGIKGALRHSSEMLVSEGMECWKALLEDGHNGHMAAIELAAMLKILEPGAVSELGRQYNSIFTVLIEEKDEQVRSRVYKTLHGWDRAISPRVQTEIISDLNNTDPGVRSSATCCLHLVEDLSERERALWKSLGDGHISVRHAALDVLVTMHPDPADIYQKWLFENNRGTPRAQKELLEYIAMHGANHAVFEQFVESRSILATELLSASINMRGAGNALPLVMVRTILDERISQYIDIILLALEPLMGSDVLSVVRAGLGSKDAGHRANAQEALQNLDNDKIILLLGCLIERDYRTIAKNALGRTFSNVSEVLEWGIECGDRWLSECCNKALNEVS